MGTLHAWESFGDGVSPDIQAVAKGLGGGYVHYCFVLIHSLSSLYSYATIGAVLMSKKIADGIRDKAGVWKHGHTYQAHPVACAASLAVQKAILEENLLENMRVQGLYLEELLRKRLTSPNAQAAPFVFDIRGGGGFWGIEFDFTCPEAARVNFQGKQFALLVQARALENGLIIMGEYWWSLF